MSKDECLETFSLRFLALITVHDTGIGCANHFGRT